MSVPSFAIVLSTYNRPKALQKMLSHLQGLEPPKGSFEVVVCDDGSEPSTTAVLAAWQKSSPFPLTYFRQANQGQAKGRHEAILRTKAKHIVILDDDMEVSPSLLTAYEQAFARHGPRCALIGQVIPRPDWRQYPAYEAMREFFMQRDQKELARGLTSPTGKHFITQNVSFPRELYEEVGGFDPDLKLYEDSELGYRFLRHGIGLYFTADAIALHHSKIGSYQAWLKRQYDYAYYILLAFEKHQRPRELHPLKGLVTGSPWHRRLVCLLCPLEPVTRLSVVLLQQLGDGLRALGFERYGLYAYRSVQVLQLHRGIRDRLGSWQNFCLLMQGVDRREGEG